MPIPGIDLSILILWRAHESLLTAVNHSRTELNQVRKKLGLLLAEKQKELASPGQNGGFAEWLRINDISHATAYRRIERATGNRHQSDLLTETIQVALSGQNWELLGDVGAEPRGRGEWAPASRRA